MTNIANGHIVKVHYTGKLTNGEIFDSSANREPLQFEVGKGQMIPGFEKGVIGMTLSEKKTIQIPFIEAYGPVREDLFFDVDKKHLPEGLAPEVGMELITQYQNGNQAVVRIAEIKNDSVLINANHPLAGQDLTFELEIIEIK